MKTSPSEARDPVRVRLDEMIRNKGDDYASISRLLGRNPAYMQQFIKRGVPKRLAEGDRRILARYFGIGEHMLGGPSDAGPTPRAFVTVPRLSIDASAGPGAVAGVEQPVSALAFRADWLRQVASGGPEKLSVIQVTGDSMLPTLNDGDDILVDSGDGPDRLRDGIYVLRVDDTLIVKRIAMNPAGRRFTIRSDNPAYPAWEDCSAASIAVIGRVIWVSRRLV